jgi:hypothetical protein
MILIFVRRPAALIASLLLLLSLGCVHGQEGDESPTERNTLRERPFTLNRSVFQASQLDFVAHAGPGPFDSYLVQPVNYRPIEALRRQLEAELPQPIHNRGEAHITVILAKEFQNVLKPILSMAEINTIARGENIVSAPFEAICVGEGSALVNGKLEHSYFLVIKAEKQLQIRRKIAAAFVAKGGKPGDFDADEYRPHITLGFTKRDLSAEDDVVKDQTSCIQSVKMTGT